MRPVLDGGTTGEMPPFLYHGTSRLYLDQILADGLLPCTISGEEPMTCLADDVEIAIHHALHQADFEESEPVVFMIPISRFDRDRFRLEDKFVELAPSAGRGLDLYHSMGDDAWQARPWTWESMLEACGAVGYTAPIPVTDRMMLEGSCEEGFRSAARQRLLDGGALESGNPPSMAA